MNRIERLIEELCPDGVESRTLGETCEIKTGKGITKNDGSDTAKYPIISGGKEPMGFYHNFNRIENTVTVSRVGANAGYVSFINSKFYLNDKCFSIIPIEGFKEKISNSFLFYILKDNETNIIGLQSEGGVPTINTTKVSKLIIPIPPLPIQQEIVNILDTFTALDDSLQVELEARRKQYEYYRDQLLNFEGNEVEWKKLGDVCVMKSGKSISSSHISSIKGNDSFYPCFGGNGLRGFVKKYSHNGIYPIIGRQGALCGNVSYAGGKFYATEHAVVVTHRGQFISRFLYFLLTTMNLNQYATNGAQPGLSVSKLEKLNIPIPSLSEQERIVSILDKFEALVNVELPSEIAARRKQYEYYREKLLSFKPLNN